jgi:hypothetical protein
MPAIQVARTDTFEQQRQKINQIGSALFNISAGGSDLSTGNLKLGDGLVNSPSLSFVTNSELGLYKAGQTTLGFVSASKKIFQYDETGNYFFRDFKIQKKEIDTVSILDEGQNYDAGTYSNIPALGGAGAGATLNITVSAYYGITTPGSGYTYPSSGGLGPGGGGTQQFSAVPLSGGSGSGAIANLSFSNGGFSETNITTYGTGYLVGDDLVLPPSKNNISITTQENQTSITVSSTTGFFVGMILTKVSGTPTLVPPNDLNGSPLPLVISNIVNETTIQTNGQASADGNAVYNFAVPWGSGSGYNYEITKLGIITDVDINVVGNGYEQGNILTVNNLALTKPIPYTVATKASVVITFTTTVPSSYFTVGNNYVFTQTGPIGSTNTTVTVIEKSTSGSNIVNITVTIVGTQGSVSSGDTTGPYTVDTTNNENKYTVDFNDGNGAQLYPDFTLLKDNTYTLTHPSNHPLRFSIHPRGKWNIVNVGAITISTGSKVLSVPNTTGILPGMIVEKDSSVTNELSSYAANTTVVSVTSNTVTISDFPSNAGTATTIFRGAQYNGTEVTYGNGSVTIRPSVDTPATLYYYCDQHSNMSGGPGYEAVVTVNQINPKVFGSGAEILVDVVDITDMVSASVTTGQLTVSDIIGEQITGDSISVDTATIPTITASTSVTTPLLKSTGNLQLESGATSNIVLSTQSLQIGSNLTITSSNGKIDTTGEIKTTNKLNINDVLNVSNNEIISLGSNDLVLRPATSRVVKVNSSSALVIPSGASGARPTILAEDGAIRFNTTTQQYEGYSSNSSSWSSLGGVRDLDGNTYILAEQSVGANDNTLWLYNDNINTVRFTPFYQEFVNVKSVRSVNTSAPSYTTWNSNIPVSTGQYLKYRNNIYVVVSSGVTGTSGSEPIDVSGNNFPNGTATLAYFTTAVAPLTFEEISELRIAPLGGTSLSINGDLRLRNNIISTDINDIVIQPNTGKKLTVDAKTSLVLPVGTTNERGAPVRGSVRFNTTISQYEGYDGTNWSSLGGVRDVDGNTYIVPELSAGSNENILYFYNDGNNTLRVTANEIELDTIDTFTSVTSNNLNLDAQLITFNSLAASIDTSSPSRTFISTSKDNLDFGLSSGLSNDTLLRLTDTGDIYYNLGFGTGVYNGLKLFDTDLKQIELADYKIFTTKVNLVRNTVNSGSAVLYDPALHTSAKVQIIAHNETTGDKEFIEYSVIDKGTDIFFTDFGNVKTGAELISCVFDFNASNNVRVTFTLDSAISSGNVVKVTVISNIIKR